MVHSKTTLATLALFLFLATPNPSHGLILNGLNILDIKVLGTVYCTVSGNPELSCGLSCPVVPGALVTISCDGGTTTLAQAVTSPTGAYQVALNLLDAILFDPSVCSVYVKLPVAQCAVLPPTGVLKAPLSLLTVVQGLLGGLATYTTLPFTLLGGL